MALRIIQIGLIVYGIIVAAAIIKDYHKNKETMTVRQQLLHYGIGVVANFFDALGIGSYAIMLASYGITHPIEDRKIPGTMNLGVAIPVILEALLFTSTVEVDMTTLILVVLSGVVGSMIGNHIASVVSEKTVQRVMTIGLLIAALLMLGSKFGLLPAGGTAVGVHGVKLILACIGNFIFGVALCFGIGNFAPCMCMIYLLGMNPLVSFPIMMCSGAVSTPTTGLLSLRQGLINRRAVMGITVGGLVGVIVAVFVVHSMSLSTLQWLVIAVVLYSSVTVFRRSVGAGKTTRENPEAAGITGMVERPEMNLPIPE